jgi:hypothetical protein
MTPHAVKITLLDLDNADVADITRALHGQADGLRPESVPASRYGEPTTTILLAVIVAQPVMRALAAWVLKKRRKQKVEVRARVAYSDGTEVERTAVITFSASESPEVDVIKQLAEGLELSGDVAKDLLAGGGDAHP